MNYTKKPPIGIVRKHKNDITSFSLSLTPDERFVRAYDIPRFSERNTNSFEIAVSIDCWLQIKLLELKIYS